MLSLWCVIMMLDLREQVLVKQLHCPLVWCWTSCNPLSISPFPGFGRGPGSHPTALRQNQRHQRQGGEVWTNGECRMWGSIDGDVYVFSNVFLFLLNHQHSFAWFLFSFFWIFPPGQRDNAGHKAAGPCEAPPHHIHHHPEPPAHASRGGWFVRVRTLTVNSERRNVKPTCPKQWSCLKLNRMCFSL